MVNISLAFRRMDFVGFQLKSQPMHTKSVGRCMQHDGEILENFTTLMNHVNWISLKNLFRFKTKIIHNWPLCEYWRSAVKTIRVKQPNSSFERQKLIASIQAKCYDISRSFTQHSELNSSRSPLLSPIRTKITMLSFVTEDTPKARGNLLSTSLLQTAGEKKNWNIRVKIENQELLREVWFVEFNEEDATKKWLVTKPRGKIFGASGRVRPDGCK